MKEGRKRSDNQRIYAKIWRHGEFRIDLECLQRAAFKKHICQLEIRGGGSLAEVVN